MAAAKAQPQQPQDLIQQLIAAEAESADIIETAKANRKKKLERAKEAAGHEVADFEKKEKLKFTQLIGTKADRDPEEELKNATKVELQMVERDFETNGQKTIDYVISKILDVPLELTQAQKQALRAEQQ
eukprot:NODE_19659_length_833_cov_3.454674.p2 GENE.NODE_19659_length_833_cov_3.454674~~NODE_19659_length_833_cov_3.454674.p2  ORF type:complete len:146 (+),score=60.90 NODE_19659_length_833_cov_3.454674:54-440(+)